MNIKQLINNNKKKLNNILQDMEGYGRESKYFGASPMTHQRIFEKVSCELVLSVLSDIYSVTQNLDKKFILI